MIPPSAADHVHEPRLRIEYLKKHAPYNTGEARTMAASTAHRLCVLGIAKPAKQSGPNDTMGGWSLSDSEKETSRRLERAQKEAAGDYKSEVEGQRKQSEAEEKRVEAATKLKADKDNPANKTPKKGTFLRGKTE